MQNYWSPLSLFWWDVDGWNAFDFVVVDICLWPWQRIPVQGLDENCVLPYCHCGSTSPRPPYVSIRGRYSSFAQAAAEMNFTSLPEGTLMGEGEASGPHAWICLIQNYRTPTASVPAPTGGNIIDRVYRRSKRSYKGVWYAHQPFAWHGREHMYTTYSYKPK